MNFARTADRGPRAGALLTMIAIHGLIVWALASGMARRVYEAVHGPIQVEIVKETVRPPPPPPTLEATPPDLRMPRPVYVPPPEFVVKAPPPPMAVIAHTTPIPPPAPLRIVRAPAPPPPAPAPPARPVVAQAGVVCTHMGKPELPALNWTGVALFKATATVRAGRVVASDVQSLKGGLDRRARRAFVDAIETALRDTYVCPGNHLFEQEFEFRVE